MSCDIYLMTGWETLGRILLGGIAGIIFIGVIYMIVSLAIEMSKDMEE